jgi:predicted porin
MKMAFSNHSIRLAFICITFFLLQAHEVAAQSQVKIFGTIDAGIEYINTGDPHESRSLRASSGSGRTSRLVFEGNEEISKDLSAGFFLDIGFWGDTGKNYPTGAGSNGIFGRRSVLGLSHKQLGGITMGREYTPQFWVGLKSDIAGLAYYGNAVTRSKVTPRASNAIEYTSPTMHGITMLGLWSAGETAINNTGESSTSPFNEGRQQAISIEYNNEVLFLAYAYGTTAIKENAIANTTSIAKEHIAGFKYRWKNFTFNGSWTYLNPQNLYNDRKAVILGVVQRLTNVTQIGMQWSRSRRQAEKGAEPTENTLSLHGSYDLSNRTMLYINLANQINNSTSSQSLSASIGPNMIVPTTNGTTIKVLLVGVSHNF